MKPLDDRTLFALADAATRRKVTLRPLSEIVAERREPRWLAHQVIEAAVLAVLAGPRGTFKSFIALDWAMRIALDGHGVVILSGEGAGIGVRTEGWLQEHSPGTNVAELPISVLERPVSLRAAESLESLVAALENLTIPPELVVVDTLSKFSAGIDENSNAEISEFLAGLSREVRERFNATVLLVAHSGHGDGKRPRGASALMANPDAEYIVQRDPLSMAVTVSRERFKDTPALPPLAYVARSVDLGRTDSYGLPVTTLVLDTDDAPVRPAARRQLGRNQERAIAALAEWSRDHSAAAISTPDLEALLSTQGVKDRKRRAEVREFLVRAGLLLPSVGGFRVIRESL